MAANCAKIGRVGKLVTGFTKFSCYCQETSTIKIQQRKVKKKKKKKKKETIVLDTKLIKRTLHVL